MRRILVLFLLVCLCLSAGCAAARKVEPTPEQKPSVIPETSKVGFSPVDLNKAPDVVKNIASAISDREAATWAQVNGTNYILVSVGKNTANKVEITDVIQKVPVQDFIWIEVVGKYTGLKEGEKSSPVTVISLNLQDKTINGVGFEVARTAATGTTQTTPAPTPATPTPAPTPAAPAPKITPAPTTENKTTPAPAKKEQTPSSGTGQNNQQ